MGPFLFLFPLFGLVELGGGALGLRYAVEGLQIRVALAPVSLEGGGAGARKAFVLDFLLAQRPLECFGEQRARFEVTLHLERTLAAVLEQDRLGGELQAPSRVAPSGFSLGAAGLQVALEGVVGRRIEELTEYGCALLRGCVQQFSELALRDHDDLGELAPIEPEELHHGLVGIALAGERVPSGAFELDGRAFQPDVAGALAVRVGGRAPYAVALSPIGELQFNEGLIAFEREVAVQVLRRAPLARRFPEQGERQGVEQRGLTRSGVSADKVKARCTELGEVELGFACIGTEGLQREFFGPH